MNRKTAQASEAAALGGRGRSGGLAGSLPALPAIALAVLIVVALGLDNGGYFPATYLAAAAIAFLAVAVLVLVPQAHRRLSAPALVAVGSLAAFAAWIGLSSVWSTAADTPLHDTQRAMLYVALFGLALLGADSGRHARLLIWSVLAGALIVVGAGVLSRLQPGVLAGTTDELSRLTYRLEYPLGYWNAFGALAAIAGVLSLGLSADPRTHPALRAAASGASVLLLVGLYLSLSRGAWLALIVGVVALLVLAPGKGSLLVGAGIVGAAVAVVALRLRSYPALLIDPSAGSGQASQGDAFTPQLVLIVLAAGAVQGLTASRRFLPELKRRAVELRRPALMGAAGLAVVIVLGGYAVIGSDADRQATRTGDWIDRQWQDFMNPTLDPRGLVGPQRLLSVKGQRSATYRVALDAFTTQPLRGEGAGSFEVRWMRTRALDLKVRDAHSLPLQTLGELGVIGLLLLLSLFAAMAVAARRCLSGRAAIRRAEAAAVTAAFVTWLAHASVDWDWEMPAVTGTALVLTGALFQRGRKRRSRSVARTARAG